MAGIKYFPQDSNIEDKNIILRLDLNVPLKDKKIQDFSRITSVLPFLRDLIKKKSKIIIIAHLGRPKGRKDNKYSLLPIYKYLKLKLENNIYFYTGEINDDVKNKISYLKQGDVLLIENIRFFKEETYNEESFSKKLGDLADIYINDAFSCCHRKQASIHMITKFIKKSYAGPLVEKEINAINSIIEKRKKPVTCIIGGSKISTKIGVVLNLIKNVDNIIVVGAMANNFLTHKNIEVGKSLVEDNTKDIIDKILIESKKYGCKIIIPKDCLVSKNYDGTASVKTINDIARNEMILDIGPQTIEDIKRTIDQSNTIMWNGPAGYFENKEFALGTNSIAEKISNNTAKNSLISVLGGGDTLSAINKVNIKLNFTHLSTAGGAFLEYLEGKELPGLTVLKN